MFVDDYTPMKRIGIEELEGCMNLFQQRMDQAVLEESDKTDKNRRDEGAWLALHLILTGKFRYPEDFLAVFDNTSASIFE